VFRMVSTCRCSELEPRACLDRTSYPIVVAPLFIMGDMLVWLPQYLLHTELSGWRTCIMLWLFQVKFPFRWMLERCLEICIGYQYPHKKQALCVPFVPRLCDVLSSWSHGELSTFA
jgi:hypothetical protein